MAEPSTNSSKGVEPHPRREISATDFPGLRVLTLDTSPFSGLSATPEQSPVSIRNGVLTLRVAGFNPDEASHDVHSLGDLRTVVNAARELPFSSIRFDMAGVSKLSIELLSVILAARHPSDTPQSPALQSVELSGASEKVLEKLDMLNLRKGKRPILPVMNALPQVSPTLEPSSKDMELHECLLSGISKIIQAQREGMSSARRAFSPEPELKGPVAQASYDDSGITVSVTVPSVPEQTKVSAAFNKFIMSASREASAQGVPLIVDCSEMSGGVGADALGALISARNDLARQGLALRLINPSAALREQMELTRTGPLFGIESRKAA